MGVDEVFPEILSHAEEQAEEADHQTPSNGEEISQLHVVGWAFPMINCRIGVKAIIHHSVIKITRPRKKLKPCERKVVLFSYGELRDDEEAKDQNEEENVELPQPLQEVEVGQNAGPKLAPDDL